MRIATWNVNSIKKRLPHVLAFLGEAKPDVLVLQELKCVDGDFPRMEIESTGYRALVHGQKASNGVALIARALSGEPRLLVMDEPTASLDFGNQARVLGQVRRLAEAGIAVLFSTHDPGHALLCADRLIALHAGRLVADGPAAATVTPELLRLIYGIDVVVAPVPGLAAPVCVPVVA